MMMQKFANSPLALISFLLLTASLAQAAAPANDLFSNRIAIIGSSGQLDATNVNATRETGEPIHYTGSLSVASVWWSWYCADYGKITISTCGSNFDTVLAVYTGTTLATLVKIASSDDSCPPAQSAVTFNTLPGTTYKIAVASFTPSTGAIVLNWDYESENFSLMSLDFNPAAPASAQPGNLLNMASWTVTGPHTSNPIWLEFFASNNGGFTLSRFGGTVTNSQALNGFGGGVMSFTLPQTLNWLPDGIYTIVGFVNRPGTGGPTEHKYSDNWAPLAGKRLRVRNTQAANSNIVLLNPTYTRNGNVVTVFGTIKNTGSTATPDYGFWIESAYGSLSAEGNFMPAGYIGGGVKVGRLGSQEAINYSQMGTAPPNSALAIMADSTDLVPETEERDNWDFNGHIPSGCGTNLDVGIVSASISGAQLAPVELSPSAKLKVNFTLINRSPVASGPMWIEFFASQTGGLSTLRSGVPLLQSQKVSIGPSRTQSFSLDFGFERIPDGIYSIVAIVNRCGVADNPGDKMPYGTGGDNLKRIAGRIILKNDAVATSDLYITGFGLNRFPNKIEVNAAIKNKGSAPTGAFWSEAFYGDVDPQTGAFIPHGQIGGGIYTNQLAAGTSIGVFIEGAIPTGGWAIGFISDSTDLIPEIDETNNWFISGND